MTVEDPSISIVRFDERLGGVLAQIADIKAQMVTKEGTLVLIDAISRLERALSEERLARLDGDNDQKRYTEKVEARLQTVEDRLENRKYLLGSGIALGAIGILLGLFGDVISRAIGGG